MKTALISLLIIISFCSYGQELIKPIEQIGNSDKNKMILLCASWCSICNKGKEILKSDTVSSLFKTFDIDVFQFDFETMNPIEFNNITYNFIPTGIGSGEHEFIEFLQATDLINAPPAYIFINDQNEVISYSAGLISKSDWISLFSDGETHF